MADQPFPLHAGSRVGRYEVLKHLSQGGMGAVVLAQDLELERIVVLKHPLPDQAAKRSRVERMVREAQVVANLDHSNIVRLYEIVHLEAVPILVLEHIEGESMAEFIERIRPDGIPPNGDALGLADEPFPHAVAARMAELCDAVAHANEAGVVHRDIKPGNIMLDEDRRPRLVDFGLAHVDATVRLTRTEETPGTEDYLAPELLDNQLDPSPRSDVYALGVTLYELSSLKSPFESIPRRQRADAIRFGLAPPARRQGVPDDLSAIIERAMASDSRERYASARELRSDLERFRSRLPVHARPTSALRRAVRLVQRHPTATAAALAITVLCVFSLVTWHEARAAVRINDHSQAVNLFRQALTMEHGDARLTGARPTSTLARESALGLLDRAAELSPSFEEARVMAAAILIDLGRGDEARAKIATLERLRGSVAAQFVGSGPSPAASPVHAIDTYLIARQRARSRTPKTAIEALSRIEDDPAFGPAALFLRGVVHQRSGSRDALTAHLCFFSAGRSMKNDGVVLANLASSLFRLKGSLQLVGRGANAQEVGSTLHSLLSQHATRVLKMIDSALAGGTNETALLRYGRGLVGLVLGAELSEIRSDFRRAIELGEDASSAIGNWASASLDEAATRRATADGESRAQELELEVLETCERYLRERPTDPTLAFAAATAARRLGRIDRVRELVPIAETSDYPQIRDAAKRLREELESK